jgi:hypothetical protein
MAKLVRLHDPGESERRVTTVLKHDQVPETLEFLATLPYGSENAFIRGLIHQWVLAHKDSPTLDDAVDAVLNGPGGRITTTSATRGARPLVREKRRTPRRTLPTPRPAAESTATGALAVPPSITAAPLPAIVPALVAAPAARQEEAPMVMPDIPAEVSSIGQAEEDDFFAGLDKL